MKLNGSYFVVVFFSGIFFFIYQLYIHQNKIIKMNTVKGGLLLERKVTCCVKDGAATLRDDCYVRLWFSNRFN